LITLDRETEVKACPRPSDPQLTGLSNQSKRIACQPPIKVFLLVAQSFLYPEIIDGEIID
jgi:hypothetical protein